MRTYRWWYFAAAVIMSIAVAAFYVGIKAYPSDLGVLVPGLLVCGLPLAGFAFRLRVTGAPLARQERLALGAAAALAALTVLLHAVAVDDGLSFWTVATGVLPALPFLLLAGQSQRVLART